VTDLQSMGIPDEPVLNGCGFASEVVEMAEQHGVKLCLETGPLDRLKQVGKRFDSVRYCLDTGFAHLDAEHPFRQYVDELAERVVHLHLTDNYGQADDHEPPGLRGGTPRQDWDYLLEILSKLDNDIVGSLEMCPCMPEVMIRQASEFMFDSLQWPNPPEKQPAYEDPGYQPE